MGLKILIIKQLKKTKVEEKFLFTIHSVEKINYNGLEDVIISIQWSYNYFLNTPESRDLRSVRGNYTLDMPEPGNFTPLSSVDYEILKTWMTTSSSSFSNQLDLVQLEQRLRFLMNSEILPTFTNMIEGLNKLNQA